MTTTLTKSMNAPKYGATVQEIALNTQVQVMPELVAYAERPKSFLHPLWLGVAIVGAVWYFKHGR